MKKWIMILAVILIGNAYLVTDVFSMETLHEGSIKITIKEENDEYKWTHESPNKYEYQHNNQISTGNKVKKQVIDMIQLLNVHDEPEVENLVARLQEADYEGIERLDIRYMNEDGRLFTWVWQKKKE